MGKITINELHKSLFDYVQAVSDDRLETRNKTIVGAINELISNNNNDTELNNLANEISNGKQLIANAIGEPLTSKSSFNEMSSDINNLLSIFKTNMMNNGITVESGDKFKALIDKIATMVEEGSSKGIQLAEGTINNVTIYRYDYYEQLNIETDPVTEMQIIKINCDFGFIPTRLFLTGTIDLRGKVNHVIDPIIIDNTSSGSDPVYIKDTSGVETYIYLSNITENGFDLCAHYSAPSALPYAIALSSIKWYAIGVGEEDTTLRDSLASILEEEGVEVTEEDDMASLITKVDEEFDRKNANAVSLISGTSYTLLNSTELDVYSEMINKEVLYTHNYPGGVIKFSTLIENMGRTDSDGWYTAYDSTYLVVNHIRNGKTISSVTYRHKIKYEDYGENEVEQSVDYIVENGDKLQFLGNAPQGVAYSIQYIKLTADIQW